MLITRTKPNGADFRKGRLIGELDPMDYESWPRDVPRPVGGMFTLLGEPSALFDDTLSRAFFDTYQEAQALFRRMSEGVLCSFLDDLDATGVTVPRQYDGPCCRLYKLGFGKQPEGYDARQAYIDVILIS